MKNKIKHIWSHKYHTNAQIPPKYHTYTQIPPKEHANTKEIQKYQLSSIQIPPKYINTTQFD